MEKKKMTKEAAHKLLRNRKVYVNGKSADIQKKLFELGFTWDDGSQNVKYKEYPFLYISDTEFNPNDDMEAFRENIRQEISAEEIEAIEIEPECPFKYFDRVIVKDTEKQKWIADQFSHYDREEGDYPYITCGGRGWRYCIPFEGNEDLVGTTNEPRNIKNR